MKLLVGLGNPGSEYVGTRHNIGFDVIDALAESFGLCRKGEFDRVARSRFDGLTLDGVVTLSGGVSEKVLLLKPMTYMNLSGQAVQQASRFFQIAVEEVMIVLDDVALPCGKIRMRASGSSGGHNGLKDIERALGTVAYPRLRIGVDTPPPPMRQRDYVLGRFSPEQKEKLKPIPNRVRDAIMLWMEKGIDPAMSRVNVSDERGTMNDER